VDPPHWPLFELLVRTPRVELRYPDDDLLDALLTVAAEGIHDPAVMPFQHAWTDRPPGEFERGFLQFHWRNRGSWEPAAWSFDLAVIVDGDPVGMQGMVATDFARLRSFETGSWLGQAHQGRGLGKEMRAAILHLGFAGLGAEVATTGAWEDNHASLGVTRALGYRPNGERFELRRGERARQLRFVMTRGDWEPHRRDDIVVEGIDACRPLFGIG
jgi:RimJ/RimL family protein N-acetyltransferase